MSNRAVTERDFRMPEFRDANPADYEFRDDGKIVRKDRWERGIHSIRSLVGLNARSFEIPEVVEAVRKLAAANDGWVEIDGLEPEDFPEPGYPVPLTIRLTCGSTLTGVTYDVASTTWRWKSMTFSNDDVEAWREAPAP